MLGEEDSHEIRPFRHLRILPQSCPIRLPKRHSSSIKVRIAISYYKCYSTQSAIVPLTAPISHPNVQINKPLTPKNQPPLLHANAVSSSRALPHLPPSITLYGTKTHLGTRILPHEPDIRLPPLSHGLRVHFRQFADPHGFPVAFEVEGFGVGIDA
jgi:hypothetical protein